MLNNDADYEKPRLLARGWAAEWSRTAVVLYEGEHDAELVDIEPLYTAIAEIDRRTALWERASEALHVHAYQWPLGPYPDVRKFTLFVVRQTAGDAAPTTEACVQIVVDGKYIRVHIVAAPGTA